MRRAFALLLAVLLAIPFGIPLSDTARAEQRGSADADLPPIPIDALDNDRWSISDILAAPGQTLIITNRGVGRHTFTIPEWGISVQLDTLQPVAITVPPDVEPGESFAFFCGTGDHRQRGQEGRITIASPEQIRAGSVARASGSAIRDRIVVEARDNFSFSPAEFDVHPGALIEVRNTGAIEHHFVVDEWALNETISPGEVKLIHVPPDVEPGDRITFYCSIPGHRAAGMIGTLTVVDPPPGVETPGASRAGPARAADLGLFLPDSRTFGEGWLQLRTGNASAVITGRTDFNVKVFPGEGLGAAYVGPEGSRAVVLIMPLATTAVPVNQVQESVLTVQASMTQTWSTDQLSMESLQRIPPPRGCDIANRASGIAPIFTLPAGSTVCQLRNAGVAIFVSVEGEIDGATGVEAADVLISRLLALET